jgi:hypothetical protein
MPVGGLGGGSVGATESDVAGLNTPGHRVGLCSYGVFIKVASGFVKRFRVVEHLVHVLNELIQALVLTTLDGFLMREQLCLDRFKLTVQLFVLILAIFSSKKISIPCSASSRSNGPPVEASTYLALMDLPCVIEASKTLDMENIIRRHQS